MENEKKIIVINNNHNVHIYINKVNINFLLRKFHFFQVKLLLNIKKKINFYYFILVVLYFDTNRKKDK